MAGVSLDQVAAPGSLGPKVILGTRASVQDAIEEEGHSVPSGEAVVGGLGASHPLPTAPPVSDLWGALSHTPGPHCCIPPPRYSMIVLVLVATP